MTRRVLVTGAGGYLGGRVARSLAARGDCDVLAGVRHPVAWLDPIRQVAVHTESPFSDLVAALTDVDTVIHLAVPNEVVMAKQPEESLATAITGAYRIAATCREAGVSRLVYASTFHVYGAAMVPGAELTEDVVPAPRNVYATARIASEHIFSSIAGPGAEVVVLRLTNVVGAPADPAVARWSLLANDLCRQAATTGTLRLESHGLQWRDFLAMSDACRVFAAAAGLQTSDMASLPAGTYNAGSGRSMTVRDLATMVQDAWERRTGERPALIAPEAPGQPTEPWQVSVRRLESLGFEPIASIADALDDTVACCLRVNEVRQR